MQRADLRHPARKRLRARGGGGYLSGGKDDHRSDPTRQGDRRDDGDANPAQGQPW